MSWGPSTRYFNGQIDEVAIYKAAIAAGDITESYHSALSDDRTPSATPVVNYIPLSTYGSSVVLSWTKNADTSILINGEQVVPHDSATTWQFIYPLKPGQNILEIRSRDLSGNRSEAVAIVVECLAENQHADQPQIEISSPGQAASYWPGDTGTATVTVTHAREIDRMVCSTSGAASGIFEWTNSLLPGEAIEDFDFVVRDGFVVRTGGRQE